ncbi:PREDICTED: nucleoside diphosphate kinase homolog 5-like [Priapulus caudatus]|uniref:Nucleoside diphosphate kinase homolog 5-like n=1 Tax=Priapulus caudatus TaxID=37621 RepID=A0ABM1DXP8_PRICU|nr:PREDICTED: nucleoside diphosphate kinase homolog 5-like [Priapulus caudatus]
MSKLKSVNLANLAANAKFAWTSKIACDSKRRVQLTPEQTSDFYAEHYGKMFFPNLVTFMSSGPVLALILAQDKAISKWREMIGPTNTQNAREIQPESLRAIYGTDGTRNGVHGSDSFSSAEREIRFFFPERVAYPIMQRRDSLQSVTVLWED